MYVIEAQVIHDGNPIARWKATDVNGKTIAFVTNLRAVGVEPSWRISHVNDGKSMAESPESYPNDGDAKAAVDKHYELL